jgi:hypothetical protein
MIAETPRTAPCYLDRSTDSLSRPRPLSPIVDRYKKVAALVLALASCHGWLGGQIKHLPVLASAPFKIYHR